VQAALTGHLLLSSLHTNDAPTAIPRLFDLAIPPFLVATTLNLIIAQRLVRKICKTCIYSYEPPAELAETVMTQLKEMNVPVGYEVPKLIFKGKGCDTCGGSGYRGRFGIFEVLDVTEEIRNLVISPQFKLESLRAAMRKNGATTMFEDGLKKVELGLTTIEEVLRVVRE
jgi:type II secretory ATPase GspE/PulE/Tfp pilus assembly ATPase PilB-like protein